LFDQLQKWAADEAARLEHRYVGTEHLLLALMRVKTGGFVGLMQKLKLHPLEIRNEVLSILGHFA
jgi:ATP-dependent Clp protease ATP-binding subunit ClpC